MRDNPRHEPELTHPNILVVGDVMLDRYTWGDADRVSPEAPVVVLRATEREVRLGGAASVASLLRGLEAQVSLAGVIGDDQDGRTLLRLTKEAEIDSSFLQRDPDRPTTTKERLLGNSTHRRPHQILRVDTESTSPISRQLSQLFAKEFLERTSDYAAVLVSDYAKGVCQPSLLAQLTQACRESQTPILIDPARGVDFEIYRGATLLKPNRLEAELALGRKIRTPKDAIQSAEGLRSRYNVQAVVITLDVDGLVVVGEGIAEHRPIESQEICDITGAGDTALAALGLALTSGWSLLEAADLANSAAGLQVSRSGVGTMTREELFANQLRPTVICDSVDPWRAGRSKLISLNTAAKLAASYRAAGKTVGFTNGCFDLLHVGHVTTLQHARALCDVLMVAINSDISVRCLKGPTRPVISEQDRARMLSALDCVDHVLIFDDATPHSLLQMLKPDVLIKGGTTNEIIGREIVEAYGGRVIRTTTFGEVSTTTLVQRVQQATK